MKKIAVIPLDNRPCCYRFPLRLGEISAVEVFQPPLDVLGNYTEAGDREAIRDWLRQIVQHVDGIVIAVDQLAYGGLVASRTADCSLDEALQHLAVVQEIRSKHAQIPIFAANVLMRISTTSKNKQYTTYWKYLFDYSQLYDRYHRLGDTSSKKQLDELQQKIPEQVLEEYWQARHRNHELNKKMIEWAADGTLDFLIITQEDASEYGVHVGEQQKLMQHVYEQRVYNNVLVYPGADEAVQTLIARMVQHLYRKQLKIYPRYSSSAGRRIIPDFEDRPLEETVKQHIYAAGALCVEHRNEADIILFVHPPLPIKPHRDQTCKTYFHPRHNVYDVVQAMRHALIQGQHVALADVAVPNAADVALMQLVFQEKLFLSLCAYAGWNTSGNTLGTTISHALLRTLYVQSGDKQSHPAAVHYAFLVERLMDEWAYQAQIRAVINQWLVHKWNISPNDLQTYYEPVNARVQAQMKDMFQFLTKEVAGSERYVLQETKPTFALRHVSLPWNRTFEVDVRVACTLQN